MQPINPNRPANYLEQLESLGKLRAQGALTEEEFQEQKAKLLGNTTPIQNFQSPPIAQTPWPNTQYQKPAPKPKRKIKWWGWVLIGIAALVLFYTVMPKAKTATEIAQSATATAAAITTIAPLPTPKPTATQAPTATPAPTSTPVPVVSTTGFAIIRSNVSVYAAPDANSKILETTSQSGVVSWQNKTVNDQWYERQGGGWVRADTFKAYASQDEALAALPKPTVVAKAGSITRELIQTSYELLGFVFSEGNPSNGQPNILGNKVENGLTYIVQIIGPADNVTDCSVTVSIPSNNAEQAKTAGTYIGILAGLTVSDSSAATKWISENLANSLTSQKVTIIGKRKLTLQGIAAQGGAMVVFSVEPV